VKTGPCAPAGCGPPRLAGCAGPVLSVEWDSPIYDGGAELVAYRVWVRPFSATDADEGAQMQGVWEWLGYVGILGSFGHDSDMSESHSSVFWCILRDGIWRIPQRLNS